MPAALVFQGPLMDMVLTLPVFMHAFWWEPFIVFIL
jgi:hypothetical protein